MSRSVLVVDDSSIARRIIKRVMENQGYRVLEARNGNDGLKMCQKHNVRLIITDVNMPGMDGLTMLKEVRKIPLHKRTPAVVVSTEVSDDCLRLGRLYGVQFWVRKPLEEGTLQEAARRAVAA